jgi:hypothetical protein
MHPLGFEPVQELALLDGAVSREWAADARLVGCWRSGGQGAWRSGDWEGFHNSLQRLGKMVDATPSKYLMTGRLENPLNDRPLTIGEGTMRGVIALGILNLIFPGSALFWRRRVLQGACYLCAFGVLQAFRHDIGLLWAVFVYVMAQVHFYKVARPSAPVPPLGRTAKTIVWISSVGLWALYSFSRGVNWTNGGAIVHPLLLYILVTAAILTPAFLLTFWLRSRATRS